ncbi:MAG: lactam utilization protein LamB [Flavobacteriales bacterium]|nr:lactam utilization protein LamB [Flavobacteriales bacterium]
MKNSIDINVDVGEGVGNELEIIPYVSSINVACGGHAGDASTVESVLQIAKKHNVRIGAHPGFEDRVNFGRIPLKISIHELRVSLIKQMNLIQYLAIENGVFLSYIKPHGALYHLACTDEKYARLLTEFAQEGVSLMGLPKSVLEYVCKEQGIGFISEGFADRVYEADGNLRKRTLEGSVHHSYDAIMNQVINLCSNQVSVFSNEVVELDVDSICFHGDHAEAEKIIQKMVAKLKGLGVGIRS